MKSNKNFKFWNYLSKYKCHILLYILLGGMLYAVMNFFLIIAYADVISNITLGIKFDDFAYFNKAIYTLLFIIGLVFIKRLLIYADLIIDKTSLNLMRDLRIDLTKQAFKLNSETYSNYGTGIFTKRLLGDSHSLAVEISNFAYFISDFIISAVTVVYMMTINIYVGLLLFAVICIMLGIEYWRTKCYKKNYKQLLEAEDKIYSITTEIIKSEKDIKAIDLESELYYKVSKAHQNAQDKRWNFIKIEKYFNLFTNLLIYTGVIASLIFGVILMDKALLTMSGFMIIYSNTGNFFDLPVLVKEFLNSVNSAKTNVLRMSSLFDEKNFITEKFGKVTLEKSQGKIEFKNVDYVINEYELIEDTSDKNDEKNKDKQSKDKKTRKLKKQGSRKNKDIDNSVQRKLINSKKLFENLNFVIEPNTTVAFVGKSGSGKSTILDLISKMKIANSGEVLIDGVNINDLTKNSLRSCVSLVNQFPYIFDMSIKDNMLLVKQDASEDEIWKALKDASLDDFVQKLPKKLDTHIGENGVKLSGGQKQRLAIARVLLRKSNILIFDESTSSLDNFAQEDVKRTIDNLKGQSTIIIVAHRLSTIKNVDKIFFLENGKITDEGTFEELFDRNKNFKNMYMVE